MARSELVKYYQSDDILEVSDLRNGLTNAFLNSATLTVTMVDGDGTEVVGQAWPLTLLYISASDGIYRGTLVDTLTLVPGRDYKAKLTVNAGAGLQDYRELPVEVVIKGKND